MEALERSLSLLVDRRITFRNAVLFRILILALLNSAQGFNLDVDMPLFKYGPERSYFGYAVAQHFIGNEAYVLVGAPKSSGLRETNETGAFYSCKFNTYSQKLSAGRTSSEDSRWCKKAVLERLPTTANGDQLSTAAQPDEYWTIKTDAGYPINGVEYGHSWFGATIGASSSRPGSANKVLVCAPTLVLDNAAFTDGSCFLLNNELHQVGPPLRDCKTDNKQGRHNAYGVCEQGFSAVLSEKYQTVVTGLPGVVKWTGGAVARDLNELTNYRDTKRRTGVGAVESTLKAHSYFGYSVNVGRFGFPYESVTGQRGSDVYTLVFGSPRYNDTGAVFFGKFHKDPRSLPIDQINDLKILPNFHLGGDNLIASGFGYTTAVGDINNDGLDDLLVGSPYYFDASTKQHRGGAVFVYFASGNGDSSNYQDIFLPPVKLFGPVGSNFGTSIAFLGDINEDNYQDFAIGAPFTDHGGTVYVYLGGRQEDFINSPMAPIQTIHGVKISSKSSRRLNSFGWSLAGGTDLDNNGYPDLVVGAFMSDAAVILRTRPIIHVKTDVDRAELVPVDKDSMTCPDGRGEVCFAFHTVLSVTKARGFNVDLSTNLFNCKLEVLHYETASQRAYYARDRSVVYEWKCGQGTDRSPQRHRHHFRLPSDNSDWLNPLKFRFSVSLAPEERRQPVPGQDVPPLSKFPVLDKRGSEHEFLLPFNKKCGTDNECVADLQLYCDFVNLTETVTEKGNKLYVKQSGNDRRLDVMYTVINAGERAYEAILNITYDTENIDYLELVNATNVRLKNPGENPAIIALGNPLRENEAVNFTVQFIVAQTRAGGLLAPLISEAMSSSQERNPDDNICANDIKVIKQVEAELTGISQNVTKQTILYYGGKVVGESAMKHVDDIGQEVFHIYDVQNRGPWIINNAKVEIYFPYETRLRRNDGTYYPRGKWALYITAQPVVELAIPGEQSRQIMRTCRVYDDLEGINPLNLTVEAASTRSASIDGKNKVKRSTDSERSHSNNDASDPGQDEPKRALGRSERDVRDSLRPVEAGSSRSYALITCDGDERQRTANCLRIVCSLGNLNVSSSAKVKIRASLWNSTFIEDYRDVDYVLLQSTGRLMMDDKTIELLDPSKGFAKATSRAQPDIPSIPVKRRVPIWVIVVAVVGGIFLLFLITVLFWKCGFFERRRDPNQPLYTAQYKHGEDLDD